MGLNLMDLVKDQLKEAAIGQVGKMVGLGEKETSSALGKVIPTILGGFVSKASTPSGLGKVAHALDEANDTLVDDVLGFLGGDKSQLLDIGGKLIRSLFGSHEEKVTHALGRSTGVNASTIGKLLKVAGPIVAGFLARQKKKQNLDERGLGDLLQKQTPWLKEHIPPEVGSAFGFDQVTRAAREVAQPKSGMMGRLLPLLLLLALGFFAYKMFFDKPPEAPPAVTKPSDAMAAALGRVQQSLAGVSSLADVQKAVPVIEGAAKTLEGLVARAGSYLPEQKVILGEAAKLLTPKLTKWTEPAGAIPGAKDVLTPALTMLGQAIDTIAAWAN